MPSKARCQTIDGPGIVQEVDSRQGRTYLYVKGNCFEGWYSSTEITSDIGDPGRVVTKPSDFPAADKGTRLPYDPEPRDMFHEQLTIQPIAELPENLTETDSIDSLRNYEPNGVFGNAHPFGKVRNARHAAHDDDDTSDDEDFNEVVPDKGDDDTYDQVPAEWDDSNPGMDDYGDGYEDKNGPDGLKPINADINRDIPTNWNDKATPEQIGQNFANPDNESFDGNFDNPDNNSMDGNFDNPDSTSMDENFESFHEAQVIETRDGFCVASSTGALMSAHYSSAEEAYCARYELALNNPMTRQAAWNDVRKKALRLRNSGAIKVTYYEPKQIEGEVTGDTGLYDVGISRKNAFGNGVTYYNCTCPWGKWAFARQYKYVGRFCSHGYAAYMEMQSLDNSGARAFNDARNPFVSSVKTAGGDNPDTFDFLEWAGDQGYTKDDIKNNSDGLAAEYSQAFGGAQVDMNDVRKTLQIGGPQAFGRRQADAMLNDNSSQFLDGGSSSAPPMPGQQMPLNPSHSVMPDGQMEVYSPQVGMGNADGGADDGANIAMPDFTMHGDPEGFANNGGADGGADPYMQNNDHDAAGALQNFHDVLEGVPAPHQPDDDMGLEGMPVAHDPSGGMGDPGIMQEPEFDPMMDQTMGNGNMPVSVQHMGSTGGDDDLANMAHQFLARTAAKQYDLSSQEELMNEQGQASQVNSLNLSNSLYEEPNVSFLAL